MTTRRRSTMVLNEDERDKLYVKAGRCHNPKGFRDEGFLVGIYDLVLNENGEVQPTGFFIRYECLWCGKILRPHGENRWQKL